MSAAANSLVIFECTATRERPNDAPATFSDYFQHELEKLAVRIFAIRFHAADEITIVEKVRRQRRVAIVAVSDPDQIDRARAAVSPAATEAFVDRDEPLGSGRE